MLLNVTGHAVNKLYLKKRLVVTLLPALKCSEWSRAHVPSPCQQNILKCQILNYDLYFLPNIVRVVKSRRMRWAGQVARMIEGLGVHRVLCGET